MSYEKLAKLAVKVHQNTVSGKINWEETAKSGVYQAEIAGASIQIHQEQTDTWEFDIIIQVFNEEGNLVEAFSDGDIKQYFVAGPFDEQPPSAFRLMQETFEVARRRALGTEQVLDGILGALD